MPTATFHTVDPSSDEFRSFVHGYKVTALWASSTEGDNPEPLDGVYSIEDFGDSANERIHEDCLSFLERGGYAAIEQAIATGAVACGPDFDEWGRAGHDLWLTRNHHGAGFWDGDWSEPYAAQLTEMAHALGECSIYESEGQLFIE